MIYPPNFPPDHGNLAEKKVYEARDFERFWLEKDR